MLGAQWVPFLLLVIVDLINQSINQAAWGIQWLPNKCLPTNWSKKILYLAPVKCGVSIFTSEIQEQQLNSVWSLERQQGLRWQLIKKHNSDSETPSQRTPCSQAPSEGMAVELPCTNFNACYSFLTQWVTSPINQEERIKQKNIYTHTEKPVTVSFSTAQSSYLVMGRSAPWRAESLASSGPWQQLLSLTWDGAVSEAGPCCVRDWGGPVCMGERGRQLGMRDPWKGCCALKSDDGKSNSAS